MISFYFDFCFWICFFIFMLLMFCFCFDNIPVIRPCMCAIDNNNCCGIPILSQILFLLNLYCFSFSATEHNGSSKCECIFVLQVSIMYSNAQTAKAFYHVSDKPQNMVVHVHLDLFSCCLLLFDNYAL